MSVPDRELVIIKGWLFTLGSFFVFSKILRLMFGTGVSRNNQKMLKKVTLCNDLLWI